MPPGPGETLLSTLFADIHYYFNDPSSVPSHHRFDRGSYVYLYHSAIEHQTKLEIANHAGTPRQDAFHGYLNATTVCYSHLQPTLFTFTVNASVVPDQTSWHLPGLNERNDQKYLYKLHTLDIYMWTEKDAATFLAHLKAVLPSDRLDIKHAPAGSLPSEHRDSMSPVVQQLEKTAIGTPFQQRAGSVVSAHSLPGPPTPAASGGGSPKVAPLAYNPAAPAAPEPVTYREKTPPPPDDGTGTGLNSAAKYDNVANPQFSSVPGTYQGSNQTTPQYAYFSGPPQQPAAPGPSGGTLSQQQQRTPSFGPMAQSTLPQSAPPTQQTFQSLSSFGAPGPTQFANYPPQHGNYPGTPGFNSQLPPTPSAPPAYSAAPQQSAGIPSQPQTQQFQQQFIQHNQPQQHHQQQQQQPPVGGYSNYSYAAAQASQVGQHNSYGGYMGNIHEQAYRPTEEESMSHSHGPHKPRKTSTGLSDGKQQPNKIGESFTNLESKVGKYLGKLDKLW